MKNEELTLRTDTLCTENALTSCMDGVAGMVAGTVGATLVVARQSGRVCSRSAGDHKGRPYAQMKNEE